jgi:hypothetical protein
MTKALPYKFNFKSRAIKDENGKEIGRTKKQPSVTMDLPVLADDEIITTLQAGGKEAELIQLAVADLIVQAARSQFDEIIEAFGDNSEQEVNASMLDFDKLTLAYIASIPPSQRGGSAITEEDWNVFFDDYLATMVAATGKEEKRIVNHINLFKKPNKAKANKEVLAVLVDQLDIYMASSANLDDTGLCASRIHDKFSKWLTEPEKAVDLSLL